MTKGINRYYAEMLERKVNGTTDIFSNVVAMCAFYKCTASWA